MPVNVQEVKKRLTLLLKEDNLVNEYIRRFGPVIDIKNIKAIKEEKESARNETPSAAEEKGIDPIFEITVSCPVCNYETITGYELKAKALQITENFLLQSNYKGAMGHQTVDYDRLSVIVCPRCLFASPDKRDFTTLNKITNKMVPSQISSNTLLTLQEKIGERKAALPGGIRAETFFKRPRSLDSAVLTYRLAALRAKVEAFHELPNALYKLGSYNMKIAKLLRQKKEDEVPALQEALDYFVECFQNSNTSSDVLEYRTLYTIVALYLRLGEEKKGHTYIGVFDKLRTDLKAEAQKDPSVNTTTIEKWIEKAKYLWEERERTDLFEEKN